MLCVVLCCYKKHVIYIKPFHPNLFCCTYLHRTVFEEKLAFHNRLYKSTFILYTQRELADFPHCFFPQLCFREIILCTYACSVKGELWVANSLCFLLVMKMGGTRVNLFMEKNRLMCICVQREIYQMWQHFAECGIALRTTCNNVRLSI